MERRTKTGCITCRRRRVKCDELRPRCERCRNGNFICEGYEPPRLARQARISPPRRSPTGSQSPPAQLAIHHTNWRQEQLPLYHHFVTITAFRLFRNDHVQFWRDQVAQMSYGVDIVYEALLAIGAMHKATLLACQADSGREMNRFRILGLRTYGNVIRMLPKYLVTSSTEEVYAVLIVLMLLAYFECFMENSKSALRHLYAAIQLLRKSEGSFSDTEILNVVPVYDAMLRLDFLAQKLVPFASSSFVQTSQLAMNESPFWNRQSPEYGGIPLSDKISNERYRLIQLICAHNKLSRVIWGCWCPVTERPSRHELLGFHAEMQLWRANSPATFEGYDDSYFSFGAIDLSYLDTLPIPPPPLHVTNIEAALSIAVFNGYLGCATAMICTTDTDPAARELENYNIVYKNMRIAAGLIEKHAAYQSSVNPYKPCDALSIGIALYLYHAGRRCYSEVWQKWTISTMRSIGREGLANGYTYANVLDIMCDLEHKLKKPGTSSNVGRSPLGPLRERLIPLLMPREEDDQLLAFYLRYGSNEFDNDEGAIRIAARATWTQDFRGQMEDLKVDMYESIVGGEPVVYDRPKGVDLFNHWRESVELGWHGYLAPDVGQGLLQEPTALSA